MPSPSFSNLKRQRFVMPAFIRVALTRNRLMSAYRARPAYQQNDYIGWIIRAKRKQTALRRLMQMLEELRRGDAYMRMPYHKMESKHDC